MKALLAAAFWAVSTVMLTAQTRRVSTLPLNALRSLFAALFVFLLLPFGNAIDELRDMSAPTAIAMIGSGILAMAVADSLYFVCLATLGAALSVPITNSVYPILSLLLAALWLDETITAAVLAGTVFVIIGIFLLLYRKEPAAASAFSPILPRVLAGMSRSTAFLLLMISSFFFALSSTWLRAGAGDLGPIAVGSLRIAASTGVLLPVLYAPPVRAGLRRLTGRDILIIAIAGVIGVGVGTLFFTAAIIDIGAGRTAILTSTMPLFTLPLAVLFLHERVTPQIILGTIICILGIWFII